MRTFLKITVFIFYMIGAIFKTIKLSFLKKFSSKDKYNKYLNKSVYKWAKFSVDLVGVKLHLEGEENIPNETCLFVSNHQSNLDVPCLIAALNRPMGFISKKELIKAPVISTWMKAIHCVFMDRKNVRESLKSIKEGADILKSGNNMVIFPEGTRSKSNAVGEFKKGSMKLATKAEVRVVPITIDGTYKAWEGNGGKGLIPADVTIKIHKGIEVKELDREKKSTLAEDVRDIILCGIEK
ncbi:lysophospholipid acyltransferase family protein [Clostridium sp. KNHs214]|uniref:lysophospholipid acyltransferase family protein n=1 Tax=Clostridium sp. KNHs214 TaxID=1540257 RepID=UPI000555AD59|nr:lysophospholipid acyltransferase family protein [Clostridium sp. KNHs214]